MVTERDKYYLRQAVELARHGMEKGQGGPFGCVIVKEGRIVGRGCNEVISAKDPTAHAEMVAIRDACHQLGDHQLSDCDVYASCEPCPMCLGALYWARPRRVLYAATRDEAAGAGFDDAFIYREIETTQEERKIPFIYEPVEGAAGLFDLWKEKGDKRLY